MTPQALLDAGLDLPQLVEILYGDINGYDLANKGKERIQDYGENFVYGEVSLQAMWEMLHHLEARPGDVFYDLGSGTGKAVIFAGLLFEFAKCAGIEYLSELHASAQSALQRYQGYVLPLLQPSKSATELSFICDDLRDQDISDGDIVLAHCTTWNDDLMGGVRDRVEKLKSGARVITVSRDLSSEHFTYLGLLPVEMAWGNATAYMYEKI